MDKIKRIKELVEQCNKYRDEYYNNDNSLVSDKCYDSLFDELKTLEDETQFILSNSPTQSVGYEVVGKLQKRVHPTPLKSLNKTKSLDDLNKWKNNKDIILMLKNDGLTVELDYNNGDFIGGYTRGNGETGEDITHNCKTIKNIPLKIPFKGKLRVSGEAIIYWNDFNDINSKLTDDEKYATPRNLAAGSIRQLDSKICSERNIQFHVFNILECSTDLSDSKDENFNWLMYLGFYTIIRKHLNKDITQKDIEDLKSVANTENIPIDGLVASFDSIAYSNSLSETAHHPLHSLALKFFDETEESILRSVEWNTTRSRQINPTAIFDMVILDNTEVGRASLSNLSIIENLQLNIGSRINVSKRNMIIPYIEENLDRDNGILEFPKICPACGGDTEIKITESIIKGKKKITKVLYCTNDNCYATRLDKFVHFVSKSGLNIDGFSEASLEKFINKGWLKTFSDIYKLDEHKNEIISMDGFGKKSYTKLWTAIQNSRDIKLENFITALGINLIGKSTAKVISKKFDGYWYNLEVALMKGFDFTALQDFGQTMQDSIYNWYKSDEFKDVNELLKYMMFVIPELKAETDVKDNPFKNKKIYATGSFANYKKEEIKSLLEGLGAEFASGYAKSLDYLIVGSLKGSSKEDRAKKDGIKILSEDEFIKIMGEI